MTKRFVKPKPRKLRYILLVLIHGFTVMTIVFIGDPLNTLIVLAALLGVICFLCGGSLLSRVSVSAIMFTLIVSINAFLDAIVHIYPVPFHLLYIALLWLFTRLAVPHIENEIDVVLSEKVPIAEIDLCALFANALDNAIEACRKVSVGERQIKLQARAEKGLFILRLENSPCRGVGRAERRIADQQSG